MATKKKSPAKKRADTIAKRQQKLKEKVLMELEQIPIIEVASKKAGASSSTYYRWVKEDYIFARAAEESLQRGLQHINDVAESKVVTGIYNNDKTLIIFWLKNRHRNYADKQHHIHQIPDENPLTEERKRQIAEAVKAWSDTDYGDERDEDYEVTFPEKEKVEDVDEPEVVGDEPKPKPPLKPKRNVASYYKPKKK